MPKFRKKPVIVDAEVYHRGLEDGFKCTSVFDPFHCMRMDTKEDIPKCPSCRHYMPYISTLGDKHYISEGDYIVTGVRGERYPVKPEIFKETYEAIPLCDYCRYMSLSTSNDAICMTCEDFSNFKEV